MQGCAVSMIGLNSLVAIVLEVGSKCCPEVVGRAYADDLSATMVTTSADRLFNGLRHFNRIVQALASSGFGEISQKKTHTFGHPQLAQALDTTYQHCTALRLVGASIVSEDAQAAGSVVESSRLNTWATYL